jgi:hypothetical protein
VEAFSGAANPITGVSPIFHFLKKVIRRIMLEQVSDQCPCRQHDHSTFDRPALIFPLIVLMFASCALFVILADLPFGIQLATLVPYTALIVPTTFSAQRGQQPYFFECPVVRRTLPQIARRHVVFLAAVAGLEKVALQLRPYFPLSWLTSKGKDMPPFVPLLSVFCFCLAFAEILTNRSLLSRSHLDANIAA